MGEVLSFNYPSCSLFLSSAAAQETPERWQRGAFTLGKAKQWWETEAKIGPWLLENTHINRTMYTAQCSLILKSVASYSRKQILPTTSLSLPGLCSKRSCSNVKMNITTSKLRKELLQALENRTQMLCYLLSGWKDLIKLYLTICLFNKELPSINY